MTTFVRVKLENGAEASVSAGFAKSKGLKVLDKAATDRGGRALRDKPPVDLRGQELDEALDAAGLPKSGTAAQKRARLADHQESSITAGASPTTGGESATSKEDSK